MDTHLELESPHFDATPSYFSDPSNSEVIGGFTEILRRYKVGAPIYVKFVNGARSGTIGRVVFKNSFDDAIHDTMPPSSERNLTGQYRYGIEKIPYSVIVGNREIPVGEHSPIVYMPYYKGISVWEYNTKVKVVEQIESLESFRDVLDREVKVGDLVAHSIGGRHDILQVSDILSTGKILTKIIIDNVLTARSENKIKSNRTIRFEANEDGSGPIPYLFLITEDQKSDVMRMKLSK